MRSSLTVGSDGGGLELAPRSPDLTPSDFFLLGYAKSRVYVTKPRDFPTLEARIRALQRRGSMREEVAGVL